MCEHRRDQQPGADWSHHPEYKPYRAYARLDPIHDFAAIGAALIGLDAVPVERLKAASVPVMVLNGGGDNVDNDAHQLAVMIPGAVGVVAGSGNHGLAPSDDEFQSSLVSFLRRRWPH